MFDMTEIITHIKDLPVHTLAKISCELNCYRWPSELGVPQPFPPNADGADASEFVRPIRKWIEKMIGKKAVLLYWNTEYCKPPDRMTQRKTNMAQDLADKQISVSGEGCGGLSFSGDARTAIRTAGDLRGLIDSYGGSTPGYVTEFVIAVEMACQEAGVMDSDFNPLI